MGCRRRESCGGSAALVCLNGFHKESLQRCTKPFVVGATSRGSRHHDEIVASQRGLLMTKRFPDEPFQPIAINRAARLLLRDRQTETGRAVRHRCPGQHSELTIGDARGFLKDALEVGRRQQAHRARKATVRNRSDPVADQRSGSQAGAALGAASAQNLTTTAGCHAGTESVGTGTFQAAGLKSTFHDRIPILISVMRSTVSFCSSSAMKLPPVQRGRKVTAND